MQHVYHPSPFDYFEAQLKNISNDSCEFDEDINVDFEKLHELGIDQIVTFSVRKALISGMSYFEKKHADMLLRYFLDYTIDIKKLKRPADSLFDYSLIIASRIINKCNSSITYNSYSPLGWGRVYMRQLVRAVSVEEHWLDRVDMISPLSFRREQAVKDIAKHEEHKYMKILYNAIHAYVYILNKEKKAFTKNESIEILKEYFGFSNLSTLSVDHIIFIENSSGQTLSAALRENEKSYKKLESKYKNTPIVEQGFLNPLRKTKGRIS